MKTTFILVGVAIVIILGVLIFFFIPKQPSSSTSTVTQFPNSSSTSSSASGVSSPGSSANKTITIAAQGTNSPIVVHDFIHSPATTADPSNAGIYILTPSNSTEFSIIYNASNQFFTTTLQQEPIGQARLDAQQFLLQALGISQNQLCTLNYEVGTTDDVNSQYAGENLGFSFCPGAVALPQ